MGHSRSWLVNGETDFAEAQGCYANLGRRSWAVAIGANYLANRDKAGCTTTEILPDQSLNALCVPQGFCGLHCSVFCHAAPLSALVFAIGRNTLMTGSRAKTATVVKPMSASPASKSDAEPSEIDVVFTP